jgi:hypothetical protein
LMVVPINKCFCPFSKYGTYELNIWAMIQTIVMDYLSQNLENKSCTMAGNKKINMPPWGNSDNLIKWFRSQCVSSIHGKTPCGA